MRCTDKDQIVYLRDQGISIPPFLLRLFIFLLTSLYSFHFNDLRQWLHFLQASLSAFLQFHLSKEHEEQLVVKEPVN